MPKLCPGQDTRFWRPEDVFEVPCVSCGGLLEFFKDDVFRRCRGCGRRVENPKFSLGCAQWCEHAKACLGYDPAETGLTGPGGESLVDRVVETLGKELGDDRAGLSAAVGACEFAREIVGSLDADPKSVILAALLARATASRGSDWAKSLLENSGVHWSVADRAAALCARASGKTPPETADDRAISDAIVLSSGRADPENMLTKPGRALAAREMEKAAAKRGG